MDEQLLGMEQAEGMNTTEAETETPGEADEELELEDLPLFGGEDMEEDGDGEEAGETPDEEEPEAGEAPEAPQTIEVDGQQVPVQELVQAAGFAQRAAKEVMQLRQETALLDEFARMAGMSKGEYLQALRTQLEQARVEQVAQRQGVTPEAARQLMDVQREKERLAALYQQQQQAIAQEQARKARTAPFLELIQRYPELRDPAAMPPEVAEQIRRGTHPVMAYQDYLLRRQQASQQVEQQRQAVKDKTPGSAAGVGDGVVDDALAAFDAALNGY